MARATVTRGRNWACEVYQEDVLAAHDEGFVWLKSTLASLHVPLAISPLHDADTFGEDGVRAWVERHQQADGKLSQEDETRKPESRGREEGALARDALL